MSSTTYQKKCKVDKTKEKECYGPKCISIPPPLAIPHFGIQQLTSIEVKGAHKSYILSAIIVVAHAPWQLHMPTTTQHAKLYHFNKKMLGNPKAQHQFVRLSTYFFMFLKTNSQSFFSFMLLSLHIPLLW